MSKMFNVKALYSDNTSEVIASFKDEREARNYCDMKDNISLKAMSKAIYIIEQDY